MRKNLNKHVTKATAAILSAAMIMSAVPQVDSYATEASPVVEADEAINESVQDAAGTEEVVSAELDKYEEAEEALDAAEGTTTDNESVVEDGKEVYTNAADAAANSALSDVTTVVTDAEGETEISYDDVVENEEAANEALDEAEENLANAEDSEIDAAEAVEDMNEALDEVTEAVEEINDAAEDASEAADEAAQAAQDAAEAETKEEAQTAVDTAADAVEKAEAAQAQAQQKYDEAKVELENAEAAAAVAKEALEAAQASLDMTAEELEAARIAADEAVAYAEALKEQVDADYAALQASKEAALAASEARMKETATNVVIKPYDVPEGANFGTESAGGTYWDDSLDYFQKYIQYVFDEEANVSYAWVKQGADYAQNNYYQVSYTDENGETVTKYFNYHVIDTDGNISVYEKELHITPGVEGQEGSDAEYAFTVENGTDEAGNSIVTKYEDVQSETDIVFDIVDENGTTTGKIVKDENSELVSEVDDFGVYESTLQHNQSATKDETTVQTTYQNGTVTIVDEYGTKDITVESVSCARNKDVKRQVENYLEDYSTEDGYFVTITYKNMFGREETITVSDMNFWKGLWSSVSSWAGSGYKVHLNQTVTDESNVVRSHEEAAVIATTTATITTTTTHTSGNDGYQDTWGWKKNRFGIKYWTIVTDAETNAMTAAQAEKARLEAQGYTNVKYEIHKSKMFDGNLGYSYTITYDEVKASSQVVNTQTYTATEYKYNCVKEAVPAIDPIPEQRYWTEQLDTTNDEMIKNAIETVLAQLEEMEQKQADAQVALDAALKAQEDVIKAQEEVAKLSVDTAEYDEAVLKLEEAQQTYADAETTLEQINKDVEEAQQAYADAAEELGRFVEVPSTPSENPAPVENVPAQNANVMIIDETPVPLAATPVTPATPDANDEGEVLGANRTPVATSEGAEVVAPEAEGEVLGERRAPQTGDNANATGWFIVMGAAIAGLLGFSFAKKKKEAK